MILKEKISFWSLLCILIGMLVFGILSQDKKKEAREDLLKEIESATKKTRSEIKSAKDKWDFDSIKAIDSLEPDNALLKRSLFFKIRPAVKIEVEKSVKKRIAAFKEEPKEPLFKYKGKVMMSNKVVVIIEDAATGKSKFVEEGDMIGDFLVLRVNDKEVALKKKGEEEIVLNAVKKEK